MGKHILEKQVIGFFVYSLFLKFKKQTSLTYFNICSVLNKNVSLTSFYSYLY